MTIDQDCIFCKIISGKEPATFHHEEKDFVVFENNLRWFSTQLLFVPKLHMDQSNLWSSKNLISDIQNLVKLSFNINLELEPKIL